MCGLLSSYMDVHLSASSSVHDFTLPGEFTPGLSMEAGELESSEWLSIYVEDCLSSSASYNCTLSSSFLSPQGPTPPSKPQPPPPLKKVDIGAPAKGTSKRRRVTPANPSDSLFLHQTCWLADSELLLPKKDEERESKGLGGGKRKLTMEQGLGQQPRKCTHCLSQKTPQWRAGPSGPKTLCNACGVRFMKGRLLPEYRPAKSPTFVSYKHSNVHKKVLEMRKSVLSSSSS